VPTKFSNNADGEVARISVPSLYILNCTRQFQFCITEVAVAVLLRIILLKSLYANRNHTVRHSALRHSETQFMQSIAEYCFNKSPFQNASWRHR